MFFWAVLEAEVDSLLKWDQFFANLPITFLFGRRLVLKLWCMYFYVLTVKAIQSVAWDLCNKIDEF